MAGVPAEWEAELVDIDDQPLGTVRLDPDATARSVLLTIARAVKTAKPRWFAQGEDVVFIPADADPRPMSSSALPGVLSDYVDVVKPGRRKGSEVRCLLPRDWATAWLSSRSVRATLPGLVSFTRSPVFGPGWRWIGRPGYDAQSGIYYRGVPCSPARGTRRLDKALSRVQWKDPVVDRANFVGALLTALTMPMWGDGHPMVGFNGNKPGVGKSTLATILTMVAEGGRSRTLSYTRDEDEFEKRIGSALDRGDRVVVIDNAKRREGSKGPGGVDSPCLERLITDARLSVRRLGGNSFIERPQNDVIFALTMNVSMLSKDLQRRCLPVNLYLDGEPRGVDWLIDGRSIEEYLDEHRMGIVAELAGMVQRWVDAGRPPGKAQHSTSLSWAAAMDGILTLAGMPGFLSNFADSSHAFDKDYAVMLELANEYPALKPGKRPSEWLTERTARRLLTDMLEGKGPRAQTTAVGALFKRFVGAKFELEEETVELLREEKRGRVRYRFARVE